MVVGILTVELYIGEANSLKEKRRVLKSLIDRIKVRFNVSIAEVGEMDAWQRSVVGISFVSNEQAHVSRVLAAVVSFIEQQGAVQLIDFQTELL
ncbi:MAG: DUF503 domain-containing protein [Peptococcaceae bacterium]|nr:DUF503 domain-containing protein [Peptococcaceae bacterium]